MLKAMNTQKSKNSQYVPKVHTLSKSQYLCPLKSCFYINFIFSVFVPRIVSDKKFTIPVAPLWDLDHVIIPANAF